MHTHTYMMKYYSAIENNEILVENIEESIFGNFLNENDDDLNDAINDFNIQILKNDEKYNMPFEENPYDANQNTTKYILAGFKDT